MSGPFLAGCRSHKIAYSPLFPSLDNRERHNGCVLPSSEFVGNDSSVSRNVFPSKVLRVSRLDHDANLGE